MSKCEHKLTSKECLVCASPKYGAAPAADAEAAALRELLKEARPHVETAAEAAEERGIDNGKARQCLARIDVALKEKKHG